jgi:hypothetical protein
VQIRADLGVPVVAGSLLGQELRHRLMLLEQLLVSPPERREGDEGMVVIVADGGVHLALLGVLTGQPSLRALAVSPGEGPGEAGVGGRDDAHRAA